MSKNGKTEKVVDFFAGKGFYVVLAVCVAAIGVSGYVLLFSGDGTEATEPDSYLEDWSPSPTEPSTEPANNDDEAPVVDLEEIDPEEDTQSVLNPAEATPPVIASPTPIPTPLPSVKPSATPKPSPTPKPKPAFHSPVDMTEVLTVFKPNDLQYNNTMLDYRFHNGMDVAAKLGDDVAAMTDGVVKDIFTHDQLGKTITIEHSNGIISSYSNLEDVTNVIIDQVVTAGQVIGKVGKPGDLEKSDPTHLHFEVTENGVQVDPAKFFSK